ncbi:hypothetical protein QN416_26270, partial [Glaciimonas sp. Cout2]|nr:hypothetical protein [Glaciimonas sp. Cout2]
SDISLIPYEQAYAPGYEDMRRRVPNNGLARKLVDFEPSTPLDDVIRNVAGAAAGGGNANEAMALAGSPLHPHAPGLVAAGSQI